MKAEQLKRKIVKQTEYDNVGVVVILKNHESAWWHLHDNEEIPENCDYAIKPFKPSDYEINKRKPKLHEAAGNTDKDGNRKKKHG